MLTAHEIKLAYKTSVQRHSGKRCINCGHTYEFHRLRVFERDDVIEVLVDVCMGQVRQAFLGGTSQCGCAGYNHPDLEAVSHG